MIRSMPRNPRVTSRKDAKVTRREGHPPARGSPPLWRALIPMAFIKSRDGRQFRCLTIGTEYAHPPALLPPPLVCRANFYDCRPRRQDFTLEDFIHATSNGKSSRGGDFCAPRTWLARDRIMPIEQRHPLRNLHPLTKKITSNFMSRRHSWIN